MQSFHVVQVEMLICIFLASTLQRRWKNLRDCYTRELLRLMKVKASGNIDRKRGYIYFKQLSFLRKVVKPTKRSNDKISPNELEVLKNVLDTEDTAPQAEDPLEEMEIEGSTKTFEEEFQDSSNNYNTLLGGVTEEDFTLPQSYVTDVRPTSNGKVPTCLSSRTRQIKRNQDCDVLFLMSLVRDLQRVPDEQKLEVKIELMEVLRRAKRKTVKKEESKFQQHQQLRMTIKNEGESESPEDIEEHSLDSIKDPTTPELLEDDNV